MTEAGQQLLVSAKEPFPVADAMLSLMKQTVEHSKLIIDWCYQYFESDELLFTVGLCDASGTDCLVLRHAGRE